MSFCTHALLCICTIAGSQDQGILVRKRAIRALWECCSCPGFSRAGDAVVAVLQRADDSEESMRNLVTKICGEMWFTDASNFAGMWLTVNAAINQCLLCRVLFLSLHLLCCWLSCVCQQTQKQFYCMADHGWS